MVDHFLFIINRDRYSGAFSHYEYTAWVNQTPDGIEAWADYCSDLWKRIRKEENLLYGGGTTPDGDLADLFEKLIKTASDTDGIKCLFRGVICYTGTFGDMTELEKNRCILTDDRDKMISLYPLTVAIREKAILDVARKHITP